MKRAKSLEQSRAGGQTTPFALNPQTFQKGFVSIFSVLIIMTILALITVGFSNVTRNAQRRTIDNQLNTQAFYSAESAVNDAKAAIELAPALVKNTCQGPTPGFTYNNSLDPGRNVGYTCVLINSTPPDLVFSSIAVEGSGNPTVVPFESSDGSSIASFNVSWDADAGTGNVPTQPRPRYPFILESNGTWGTDLGMLRIDIIPTGVSRAVMESDGFTFFLYPVRNFGSIINTVRNSSSQQGDLVVVRCARAPCSTTVNLFNVSGSLSGKYTMRLQALYNSVSATISNVKNTALGAVTLQNGQAVVDATGKANDVFRRIQVRLPFTERGLSPAFAVQSADSICKRMLGSPTGSIVDTAAVDPAGNPAGSLPCALDN